MTKIDFGVRARKAYAGGALPVQAIGQTLYGCKIGIRLMNQQLKVHLVQFRFLPAYICLNLLLSFTCDSPLLAVPRLKELSGWNPNMEFADILHVVWCGLSRDVTGSLLLEAAEFGVEGPSFDDRLKVLHQKCTAWCSSNHIRPSTVEEFSSWPVL